MRLPRRVRLVLLGAVAPVVASLVVLAASSSLQGPSIDSLYWLRERLHGPRPAPDPSPVVVVGIDEETYRRPPFAGTPQALWGPRLGTVLGAALVWLWLDGFLYNGAGNIFRVTVVNPYLLLEAMGWGLTIVLAGVLGPALRLARQTPIEALREV